ncbi:MAG: glycine betaine/L-proline ABC transporter ATP-binding protein [Egibacteraceae bacterium]
MSAIQADHLFKIFGNHPERALEALRSGEDRDAVYESTGQFCAVNDVSFTVEAGELFVIMGLSGSGKSTLVRTINRLHDPTSGKVFIDDEDISTLDNKALRALRARKISMVFQTFALFPHRSVLDNAAYGLEVQRVDKAERRERAAKALDMVGLSDWGERMPKQLSGGMRQRVGLARALATEADIMLMDEPFSALDPLIRRDMQGQLIELQQELRRTIVFITHDLNEAMRLGDRVAVMKAGAIVQNDTPEAILHKPADDYVADFIQDVDRSRILTASAVMREPVATLSPRHGPKVALMELKEHQRTELYVVDQHRLLGAVRDRELAEAASRGDTTIEGCLHEDYPCATPETPIAELLQPAARYEIPVAVVEGDRFVGVVPRALLLGALGTPEEASGA